MIRLRLNKLLTRRGWTAYQLSQASGLHPAVLSKYIHNEVRAISIDTLNAMCKALRCRAGDLIEYVPDRKRK